MTDAAQSGAAVAGARTPPAGGMGAGRFWLIYRPLVLFGQWRQRVWGARERLAARRAAWWADVTRRLLP